MPTLKSAAAPRSMILNVRDPTQVPKQQRINLGILALEQSSSPSQAY